MTKVVLWKAIEEQVYQVLSSSDVNMADSMEQIAKFVNGRMAYLAAATALVASG